MPYQKSATTKRRYARSRTAAKTPRAEIKYKLHTHSHDFALSNPYGAIMPSILNGSARDQRLGNQCKLLNIKGTWKTPTANSASCRFIIYIPRSPTTVLVPALVHSPVDPNDFIVLYDKFWTPDQYTADEIINFNITLNRTVRYNGINATDYVTPLVKYVAMSGAATPVGISTGNWVTTFTG